MRPTDPHRRRRRNFAAGSGEEVPHSTRRKCQGTPPNCHATPPTCQGTPPTNMEKARKLVALPPTAETWFGPNGYFVSAQPTQVEEVSRIFLERKRASSI